MIGAKIKELRKSKKMTQLELANKLELSPSAIGMYEQDRRIPSIELLIKISEVFGVSVQYLITDDHMEVRAKDLEYSVSEAYDKEQDLAKLLEELKRKTLTADGMMFKGTKLTSDDLERVMDAVLVGVEIALKNKGDR